MCIMMRAERGIRYSPFRGNASLRYIRRIFTVDFLLFLAPLEASNHAGPIA